MSAEDGVSDDLKQRIIDAIKTVYDPEIPVNIWEVGLIYDVAVDDDGGVDPTPAMVSFTSTTLLPTVTMIVPCFNEADVIADKLKSLEHLDYPPSLLEVLTVSPPAPRRYVPRRPTRPARCQKEACEPG